MSTQPSRDADTTLYQLLFYVPPANTQSCLAALFAAGAGTWPNSSGLPLDQNPPKYVETCFITSGTGQFRPTAAANPHIGRPGETEYVGEDRVEIVVVGRETVKRAVQALHEAHPYEVVAYFVFKAETF